MKKEKRYKCMYRINSGEVTGEFGSYEVEGVIGGIYNIGDIKDVAIQGVKEMLEGRFGAGEYDFTVTLKEIKDKEA